MTLSITPTTMIVRPNNNKLIPGKLYTIDPKQSNSLYFYHKHDSFKKMTFLFIKQIY